MLLADFKQLVQDHLNRAGATFDVDTPGRVDKVIAAINNARSFAQKLLKFEAARCYCQLSVDKENGGNLSTAVLASDGITPVKIRNIEHGFVAPVGTTNYFPIAVAQRNNQLERFRKGHIDYRAYETGRGVRIGFPPEVIKDGNTIWLQPWPNEFGDFATTVKLRVVQWMPDLSQGVTGIVQDIFPGGFVDTNAQFLTNGIRVGDLVTNNTTGAQSRIYGLDETFLVFSPLGNTSVFSPGDTYTTGVDSDFFLEECRDWLMFRTIQELNFFIKEDQRVQLSQAIVQQAWEAVKSWNAENQYTEQDSDLD
jgi:hypothetical protein